jgi:plasmid stabilization system protein ParE
MAFAVLLTNDAARDLDEIYNYIALHDSPQKADYVLERIENCFPVCLSSLNGVAIRKNYWRWGFANTERSPFG